MGAASSAQIAALAKKYNMSTSQVSGAIKGSSYEYGDKVLKNNAAKSSSTTAASTVAKPKDYTKEINKLYDPLLAASDASLVANKAALNDEFTNLSSSLKEAAGKSEAGLTESMNRYGLLESGRTAAGIGKIQSDLSLNTGKADIQRAIAEADMVLQNVQYKAGIETAKLGAVQQTDPLGLEATKQAAAQKLAERGFDLAKYKDVFTAYSDGVLNSWVKPDDTIKDLIRQMTGV